MKFRRRFALLSLALLAWLHYALLLRYALLLDSLLLLVLCLRWWAARRVKWHTVGRREA